MPNSGIKTNPAYIPTRNHSKSAIVIATAYSFEFYNIGRVMILPAAIQGRWRFCTRVQSLSWKPRRSYLANNRFRLNVCPGAFTSEWEAQRLGRKYI